MKQFFLYVLIPLVTLFLVFKFLGMGVGFAVLALLLGNIIYKNFYLLYQIKGVRAYNAGNLEKALKYLEHAYNNKNSKVKVHVLYGYLLLKAGNLEKSRYILEKILKNNKVSDEDENMAKANFALVLWKEGKVDEAVEILEEVIKEYKTTTVYGSLGYLLILKGDLDRALEFNIEASEYNDSDAVILDNLGQVYFLKNEFENAKMVYKRLMELGPSFPEAYFNYGLLLEAIGEEERALENFKKALNCKFTYMSTVSYEQIQNKIEELGNRLRS